MDSFAAVVFLIVLVCLGCVGLGQWMAEPEIARSCNETNEFTVRAVVYECKPIVGFVNGKRVSLKE